MNNSKIAYLGPEGTFTHQAALLFFGNDNKFIPVFLSFKSQKLTIT